jgi:uncharacterized protein (TIGR02145 family)
MSAVEGGQNFTLSRPTIVPHNATNRRFTWSSSDTLVATVSSTGVVTTRDSVEGISRVTITATTVDGGFTQNYNITVTDVGAGCNNAAVTGFNPINASFASAQEWTVEGTGGRPTQIWSDVVRENRCNGRTAFNGGTLTSANTDCRRADNGFTGNYFSWCFVMRFADALCPGDWRVPTSEDFAILHQNLGYSAPTPGSSSPIIAGTYMGATGSGSNATNGGGTWGGARFTATASELTATTSAYWSSTRGVSEGSARSLSFDATAVHPQGTPSKNNGFALRCVRN